MDYFYKSIFNWKLKKIELLSVKVFKLLLASILGSNFRTELTLIIVPAKPPKLNHSGRPIWLLILLNRQAEGMQTVFQNSFRQHWKVKFTDRLSTARTLFYSQIVVLECSLRWNLSQTEVYSIVTLLRIPAIRK